MLISLNLDLDLESKFQEVRYTVNVIFIINLSLILFLIDQSHDKNLPIMSESINQNVFKYSFKLNN